MGRSARRRAGECAWESRVLSAPLDKRHKMQIQPRPDSGPACISRAGRGTASGRSGRRERRWNRGEATTVRSGLVTRPQELQRAEREQQHKSDQQPWIVGGMRVRTRPERAKSSAMAAAIPLHPDLGSGSVCISERLRLATLAKLHREPWEFRIAKCRRMLGHALRSSLAN